MFRATLKSLLARKVRLLLTVVSIVLGVGFVAGTFVLTDTMNKAFDELFATAASGSDVIVRSEQAFVADRRPGPAEAAARSVNRFPRICSRYVQQVPGVASASGDVAGYAQMMDPATGDPIGGVGPPTIGTNWTDTNPSLVMREGEPPAGADEVVVDAGTARAIPACGSGQDITILFGEQAPREFTITGIAGFGDADNLAGATLALFDTRHRAAGPRQGGRVRFDLGHRGRGGRARDAPGRASSRSCRARSRRSRARRSPRSSPTR